MINLLAAAVLAAAPPTVAPAAPASPAMFVVRDADTTVYIFGTFHALDGKAEWFNSQVRDAFENSSELVLETLVPEGPGPVPMPKQAFVAPVTPSASFLATTRMAISAGKSQGMQVNNGADMVLRHIAEREGKPVAALETLESQFAMFNRMPSAGATPRPSPGAPVEASPMASLTVAMAEMQSAWKRGDQRVFVRLLEQLNQSSPTTYKMLFTDRNGRWADWVAARMQTPGTIFVAVGAGHLAGKDSLLNQLAQRGIESRRAN